MLNVDPTGAIIALALILLAAMFYWLPRDDVTDAPETKWAWPCPECGKMRRYKPDPKTPGMGTMVCWACEVKRKGK